MSFYITTKKIKVTLRMPSFRPFIDWSTITRKEVREIPSNISFLLQWISDSRICSTYSLLHLLEDLLSFSRYFKAIQSEINHLSLWLATKQNLMNISSLYHTS